VETRAAFCSRVADSHLVKMKNCAGFTSCLQKNDFVKNSFCSSAVLRLIWSCRPIAKLGGGSECFVCGSGDFVRIINETTFIGSQNFTRIKTNPNGQQRKNSGGVNENFSQVVNPTVNKASHCTFNWSSEVQYSLNVYLDCIVIGRHWVLDLLVAKLICAMINKVSHCTLNWSSEVQCSLNVYLDCIVIGRHWVFDLLVAKLICAMILVVRIMTSVANDGCALGIQQVNLVCRVDDLPAMFATCAAINFIAVVFRIVQLQTLRYISDNPLG
jgi:hypothetical protein